jgi:periplasmic divalent cation tolerance protein
VGPRCPLGLLRGASADGAIGPPTAILVTTAAVSAVAEAKDDGVACDERSFAPDVLAPSFDVAHTIGRTLVEERLAACVNIIPEMHSIYHWAGSIKMAAEVVLIAKSRAALFEEIEKRVRELHPYDCPCLVAWPIEVGHQPYLDWIAKETAR